LKGINVEVDGSFSHDMNAYSFSIQVEVPGKRIIIP